MEIKGFYDTIKWYDDNAGNYAKGLNETVPTKDIEAFLQYLKPLAFVLEAGCGPGRETAVFREKEIKTVGVDISEGLLKIARESYPETEFVQANFLSLPFPEETFDGVWAHASLIHFETVEDAQKALSEFHRVLKPEGIVYIFVKQQIGDEKTAIVKDSLSNHERFFRYYTTEEISDLVVKAGFEILNTEIKEDSHGRAEVTWIEVIGKRIEVDNITI